MIGIKSLADNIDPRATLPLDDYTDGTVNGTAVPRTPAFVQTFWIDVGTWTDGTHTFQLEERETDGTWQGILSADLDGYQLDGTNVLTEVDDAGRLVGRFAVTDATYDESVVMVTYKGAHDELRLTLVTAGSTTGASCSGRIIHSTLRGSGRNPGPFGTTWNETNIRS